MTRLIPQILLFIVLSVMAAGVFLLARYVLDLPFRGTNDLLHRENMPVTLDFFIPAGVHIDEDMRIGEVIKRRFAHEETFFNRLFRGMSGMIPSGYRFAACGALYVFWTLLFLTFLRVFTFIGYARALRGSLVLGGINYFYLPDFAPGKTDDLVFLIFPAGIICLRIAFRWYRRRQPAPTAPAGAPSGMEDGDSTTES